MHTIFAILFTICNLVASESQQDLDIRDVLPYLNICRTKSQLMELCIQDNINLMHLSFLSGVPQLDIPPFEPYTIRHYEVNLTGPSSGSITFTDMLIHNLITYTINDVRVNVDRNSINFTAFFPRIITVANYNINGTSPGIILKKQGKMTGILYEIEAKISINGEYYYNFINQKSYFRVYATTVRLRFQDVFLNFNNLTDVVSIKYDSQKTKLMFLRQTARKIFPEMVSQLELIAGDFIKTTANKIYSKFPTKALLKYDKYTEAH